jgi:hypothetical protein
MQWRLLGKEEKRSTEPPVSLNLQQIQGGLWLSRGFSPFGPRQSQRIVGSPLGDGFCFQEGIIPATLSVCMPLSQPLDEGTHNSVCIC